MIDQYHGTPPPQKKPEEQAKKAVQEAAGTARVVGQKVGQKATGKVIAGLAAKSATVAKAVGALKAVVTGVKAAAAAIAGTLTAGITAIVPFVVDIAKKIITKLPIIGNVVSWLQRKIKENWKKLAIPLGITILGPFFGLPAAAAVGLGGLAALGIFATTWVLTAITSAIVVPTITAMILIPFLVLFALFVINAGGFVVPPSEQVQLWPPGVTGGGSPFIRVVKRAETPGPFENTQLLGGLTVNYSVEISAPLGNLTNISFQNTCQVIRDGSSPPCTHKVPEPPELISVTTPFTFSYTVTYVPGFEDSLVIDTFTVTAIAEGANGEQTSSGSASIIIGDPPTSCFVFDDSWAAYPQRQATVLYAITQMMVAPTFMTRLCSGGEIILHHNPQPAWWGGWVTGLKYIQLYPRGVESNWNAFYTLAHESGHVLAQVTELDQTYYDSPVGSQLICTYPGDNRPSESFAEMIALYYVLNPQTTTRDFRCLGGESFKCRYPLHWQFARDVIFLQDLGWGSVECE